MIHRCLVWAVPLATACAGLSVSTASAALVISLQPRSPSGSLVTGPVTPGATVHVDILLSVTSEHNPLRDVRLIQFDLSRTSPAIQVNMFAWELDSLASDSAYLQLVAPTMSTVYIQSERSEGLILDLTEIPVKVASIDATITAAGTLDIASERDDGAGGALVSAGFTTRVSFPSATTPIEGGLIVFEVSSQVVTDTDGDGTDDPADAFPLDPTEAQDSDSDGVGNVQDSDDDGDLVSDTADDLPLDPDESMDSDQDGIGDNADDNDMSPPAVDNSGDSGSGDSGSVGDDSPDDAQPPPDDSGDEGGGSAGGSGSGGVRCGLGMIGPFWFGFLALSLASAVRKSRPATLSATNRYRFGIPRQRISGD